MKNVPRFLSGLLSPCFLFFVPMVYCAEPLSDVLDLQQAAALLLTDTETVALMAQANTIPGKLIDDTVEGSWRFSRNSLLAWLEGRTAQLDAIDNDTSIATDKQIENPSAGLPVEPGSPLSATGSSQTDDLGVEDTGHTASDMFLRNRGVLLGEKEIAFDVGVFYSRNDTRTILGTNEPVLSTHETRAGILQGALRFSVNPNTEFSARASVAQQYRQVLVDGIGVDLSTDEIQSDFSVNARYVMLEEDQGQPEVILGISGYPSFANNATAIGGSVALLKSLDPAVLFGSFSYSYTGSQDARDISQLQHTHATSLNFGLAFALNDRLSLNSSVQTTILGRTRVDDAILPADDVSVLQLGLTACL